MSRPKRILFDANPLVNGNKSGVGYYTYNLIQTLADEFPNDLELVGHYFNFLGRRGKVDLPQAPNISYVQSRLIPGKILSITRRLGFQLPLELFFKRKGDAAIYTNFVCLPSLLGTPRIVAIHDLAFVDMPECVSQKNRAFLQKFVPRSIKSSRLVITISGATKQRIEEVYDIPSEKIFITPIPPGKKLTTNFYPKSVPRDSNYILFVSTLEPRKNILNLVKAYVQLPDQVRNQYSLVLAGGEGWDMDETLTYIKQLQEAGYHIIMTGYVSDRERAALYENASLFVMPSHYEGFGMPLLEAMDYAIPVAASDIPVFREVAGKAALFFDKDDVSSISKSLKMLLEDQAVRTSLIHAGKDRLRLYDWRSVAKKMFEQLSQLI